jgi:hypothetical protein
MRAILVVLMGFFIFAYGEEPDKEATYVRIFSNLVDVNISVDGKDIGRVPIYNHKVKPHTTYTIEATTTNEYYEKKLTKEISIPTNNIQTIDFKFEPLKAEVFLVGEDAQLYIDGKYIKQLHTNNRRFTIEAGKNIHFALYTKEKQTEFYKDLKGGTYEEIPYKLQLSPEEIRTFTTRIPNYVWEDTLEAVTQNTTWDQAKRYCEELEIAYLKDWRLPTLQEMEILYGHFKEDIYNGFGEPFYWSDETSEDDAGIWDYAMVKNFTDGIEKKSIQDFEQGKVRCIHDVAVENKVDIQKYLESDDNNTKAKDEVEPGDYDKSLTKDLQKFLLK